MRHQIIDSTADDKMFLVLELVQGGQVMNWDDKAFRYRAPTTASGVLEKEHARRCIRDVVMALSYRASSSPPSLLCSLSWEVCLKRRWLRSQCTRTSSATATSNQR